MVVSTAQKCLPLAQCYQVLPLCDNPLGFSVSILVLLFNNMTSPYCITARNSTELQTDILQCK